MKTENVKPVEATVVSKKKRYRNNKKTTVNNITIQEAIIAPEKKVSLFKTITDSTKNVFKVVMKWFNGKLKLTVRWCKK